MSKGWPNPFHDRREDFWYFDNMVNEYEWEQKRKRVESCHRISKQQRRWAADTAVRLFMRLIAGK